jgi:hypothetical protein
MNDTQKRMSETRKKVSSKIMNIYSEKITKKWNLPNLLFWINGIDVGLAKETTLLDNLDF